MIKQQIEKPFPISKRMVYNSYLKVIAEDGISRIDRQDIEQLHENLPGNLDKIRNRMASGSYFTPLAENLNVSQKHRIKQKPGIPSVIDRIALGVMKDFLEPPLEKIFHPHSFGYRPGKSVYDAISQCRNNCKEYGWVIGVKIKDIFTNIHHDILLKLLQQDTKEKWILLYAEQLLKAEFQQAEKTLITSKGISRAGTMSPLFVNIYMHHAFDKWMEEYNGQNYFERYGDEIIIHCQKRDEAWIILKSLADRMREYELAIYPGLTKILRSENYQEANLQDSNNPKLLNFSHGPGVFKDHIDKKNSMTGFSAANARLISILRSVLILR